MNAQQLKEANESIQQDRINFYMSKHISDVRNMSDIERFKYFDGQKLYAERCKSMLKSALE